jgi:phytoene dehydrogenase-like protein
VVEAIVVGSGPNGLAAAIALARAGRSVRVLEGAETIGGGMRTEPLTLPGFAHDTCSAIHPLALASPFFRSVPLADHGVEWIHSPSPLAHPLDDGTAVVLGRSPEETATGLGGRDGEAWPKLFAPLAAAGDDLWEAILAPPLPPKHPLLMARFGTKAVRSAVGLAKSTFSGERARALFAGNAAHSMLPLEARATASFGLVLALLGQTVGWPLPRRGSQSIADALASYLESLGGEIETGHPVESLDELASTKTVLFDVTPRQFLELAGNRLDGRYRRALERYRYGPGIFKLDWALSGPIPWIAEACTRAATVHVGGTLDDIARSERAPSRGEMATRPFVLVAQQSLFDDSRAPTGQHTAWAYCHVQNSSTADMTSAVEAQLERFAPGFADLVLARSALGPAALQAHNPNYVGGDINGGAANLRQLFLRPAARPSPYTTPLEGVYLCSASTPPGGGVHGMCGWHAAQAALRRTGGRR